MIWLAAVFLCLTGPSDPILLPDVPPPIPPPVPVSTAVIHLTSDLIYAFDYKSQLIVLGSQRGLVSIQEEKGPIRIHGRFADAPSHFQTRTFVGPFVYQVSPVGTGRVEIIAIPVGVKAENEIARRLLDVDTGEPAPPGPIPPGPIPDSLTALVQAAYAADAAADKQLSKTRLAFFFRDAAASTVLDKSLTTWNALFREMEKGRKDFIGEGLAGVRGVLGRKYFDAKWPREPNAPFDDVGRKLAAESMLYVAGVLEGIK